MPIDFKELMALLEAETALCTELLHALGRERSLMGRSRLPVYRAAADATEKLVRRLQAMEAQREGLVKETAERLGWRPEEATLRRLAAAAAPEMSAALSRRRAELASVLERLKTENRRCASLCRRATELVRSSIQLIGGGAAAGSVYRRGGQMQEAGISGRVLRHDI